MTSIILHREDDGLIHASVRNDGKVLYFCSKCNRIWIGHLTPREEIPEAAYADLTAEVSVFKRLLDRLLET